MHFLVARLSSQRCVRLQLFVLASLLGASACQGDGAATRDAAPPSDAQPARDAQVVACESLISRLQDLDGARSCAVDADCHLIGAYYVRPRSQPDRPEGVFVSETDLGKANTLWEEIKTQRCVFGGGFDCALDGYTYRATCAGGSCSKRSVCCNCPDASSPNVPVDAGQRDASAADASDGGRDAS